MFTVGLALLVLTAPSPAPPAVVSGMVTDPQNLPVPSATVSLACGDRTEATTTDERGRFVFEAVDAPAACVIDVTLDGFAPARERVARRGDTLVRLRLADVTQAVTVAAPAPGVRPSLSGVELDASDLQQFAGSTTDLIRYARSMAGTTTNSTVIYVDGLPAGHDLPPMDQIASISVNADAFSAEYGDGDVTTIRIVTRAPSRAFRIMPATDLLGFGGANALASGSHADTTSLSLGFRGAIPHLPITFSGSASGSRMSTDMPIEAVVPASVGDATGNGLVPTVNRTRAGHLELTYVPTAALRTTVSYRESHSDGSNVGVGGIVVREAGYASTFDTREVRAGISRFRGAFAYEGGAVVSTTASSTRANADTLGVVVGGDAVLGGASMTASGTDRTRWTTRHVLRAMTDRPWTAGIVAAGAVDRTEVTPNAHGTLQVESVDAYARAAAGEPIGTWFASRGAADVRYAALTLSPFLQKTIVRRSNVEVNGGVRADYHSEFGLFVSPRGSAAVRLGTFTLGGGAGLFATPVADGVFVRALENDGVRLRQFVATGVSIADTASLAGARVPGVRTALAPSLARPYELMERVSIERPFGRLVPGVEATWTQDRRLLGLARAVDATAAGVDEGHPDHVDTFESNRRGSRVRLHAQARYGVKARMLAAHYEWVHARDNTDGPFSYASDRSNLDADWARSSGIAAHNVTLTGSIGLPMAIALTITETWNSGAPYNITTGLDPSGAGLFVDRGGLPRNSGDGPSFNTLSLYAHRRLSLPPAIAHGVHVNLGVQADNILDNRHYIAIGSVQQSSSFGRPLSAAAGRSMRVLLSLD